MKKIPLLLKLLLSIILGIILGFLGNESFVKVFVTFSNIYSSFLTFFIPLIILGFIVPGISQLAKNSGKLLAISTILAYISTIFSGFFAYFIGINILPKILNNIGISNYSNPEELLLIGYMDFKITPLFSVMTALILAFVLGVGISLINSKILKDGFIEFSEIIEKLLNNIIIPTLPIYILGIFMNLSYSGEIFRIMKIFSFVFLLIVILQITIICIQYFIAVTISKRSFFNSIKSILPAYVTALGTQSSAATIPVTLLSVKNMKVKEAITNFTIPLFSTIHLSGSTITLVICSLGVYILQYGALPSFTIMIKFILVLGITMVAAPGVPGGAVMASLGLLETILGFSPIMISLMIALYITQDGFGTACNVSGDGALTLIIEKIEDKLK